MIKFVTKWAFRLLILVIVLVVALLLLKDSIIKGLTENRLRAETGMDVRIGKFEIALMSPTVTIQDLKIFNRPEHGGGLFVDMPELHVEYNQGAFFSRELHLRLLRLNLTEVNIVEARDGRTNLEILQSLQNERASSKVPGLRFTGIDTLNMTIGKIRFMSMNRLNRKPREVKVNFDNRILTDVKSGADLTGVINGVALKNAPSLIGVYLGL